jgi:hypothetical protein
VLIRYSSYLPRLFRAITLEMRGVCRAMDRYQHIVPHIRRIRHASASTTAQNFREAVLKADRCGRSSSALISSSLSIWPGQPSPSAVCNQLQTATITTSTVHRRVGHGFSLWHNPVSLADMPSFIAVAYFRHSSSRLRFVSARYNHAVQHMAQRTQVHHYRRVSPYRNIT